MLKYSISIRELMGAFIVVAGIISLFTGQKDIAVMCLGGALAFISPKNQTAIDQADTQQGIDTAQEKLTTDKEKTT